MPSRWDRLLSFSRLLFRNVVLMLVALHVLVISLQSVPLTDFEYAWGVCLLILLLLSLVSPVDNPSDVFTPVDSRKDIERLLQSRPLWQHQLSSDAHANLGKCIRVGQVPEHLSTQAGTQITDNLDRLVAIKKQGYWLTSTK